MTTATKDKKEETGLAVFQAKNFLALNQTAELKEAMEANAEAGEQLAPSDLIRVKTPAEGKTVWEIEQAGGTERSESLTGVLVYYQPSGVLWPSEDPSEGSLPVLRTFNPNAPNATAEQVGPVPDDMLDILEKHRIDERTVNWATLPYNQFGSGKNGVGKRCKEQRMMFLLREGDVFPLLVTAQPGSLKNITKFFKQLAPQAKVPYFRCVIELTLEKTISQGGQKYSRIVPRLVGTLSKEDGAAIKSAFTDQLAMIVKDIEIVPEPTDD